MHVCAWAEPGVLGERLLAEGAISMTALGAKNGRDREAATAFVGLQKRLQPRLIHFFEFSLGMVIVPWRAPAVASVHVFPETARHRFVLRRGFGRCAVTIAISQEVQNWISHFSGTPSVCIEHGSPAPSFVRVSRKSGDRLAVSLVTRLERGKGLDHLPEIVERVVAEDLRIRIDVFGEGSQRNSLERLSHRYPNVLCLKGGTSDLEAPYRHADGLLYLTELETFGRPLIEAMAHGLPIIGFPPLDVTRSITALTETYFSKDRTPASLIAALKDWDRAESTLGKRAHLAFQRRFTLERQATEWANVWQAEIDAHG